MVIRRPRMISLGMSAGSGLRVKDESFHLSSMPPFLTYFCKAWGQCPHALFGSTSGLFCFESKSSQRPSPRKECRIFAIGTDCEQMSVKPSQIEM